MEFRRMRRFKQELPEDMIAEVLKRNDYGVISMAGDGGYPYGVPMNYVYHQGKIYIHGAKNGHKVDAMMQNPKVSFCVVDESVILPEQFTSIYRSVIVFGRARMVEDPAEIEDSIYALTRKYSPDEDEEAVRRAIDRERKILLMTAIDIDYMTGKESMDYVKQRLGNKKD